MHKKGEYGWAFGLLSLPFIFIIVMICLSGVEHECSETTYILKSVNSITDENSGLLSGGDVSRTNLLMNDGTVISLNYHVTKLKLGEKITIRKCEMVEGSIKYKIK